MWCGFVIFVSWNTNHKLFVSSKKRSGSDRSIAFSVVVFRLFWDHSTCFTLICGSPWWEKKPTDHAIFDHLLWKNHTERVHFFHSLGFTIYLEEVRKLQTFPKVETWIQSNTAKINGLAMAEVGAKKKRFCWSPPHGRPTRHEPIEWGMVDHHHHHHP